MKSWTFSGRAVVGFLVGAIVFAAPLSAQVTTNLLNDGSDVDGLQRLMNVNGTEGGEITLTRATDEVALSAQQTSSYPDFTLQAAWYLPGVTLLSPDYTVTADVKPADSYPESRVGVMGWADATAGTGIAFRVEPGISGAFEVALIDFQATNALTNDSLTNLFNLDGSPASPEIGSAWGGLGDYDSTRYATFDLKFTAPTTADLAAVTNATAQLTAQVFQSPAAGGDPVQVGDTIELLTDLPAPTQNLCGYYANLNSLFIPAGEIGRVRNLTLIGQVGAIDKPPVVSLTSPTTNDTFYAPANITATAQASDPDGQVVRVDFYLGDTLAGSTTNSPATFTYTNLDVGSYTLSAVAVDNVGLSAHSTPVTVQVQTAPDIPQLVDPVPLPSAAQFQKMGMTLIGTVGSAFTIEATTDYTNWTAVYSDTLLSATQQVAIPVVPGENFKVYRARYGATAVNQPPTVQITNPTNNATFTAPATVTFSATATDPDGSVSELQLYSNGNLVGSYAGGTTSVTLTNLAAGTYTLTAQATDNQNAQASSSPVTITVQPAPSVLQLANPVPLPSASDFQQLGLTVIGNVGSAFTIQGTTNYTTWTTVYSGTLTSATQQIVIPMVPGVYFQAYRGVYGSSTGNLPPSVQINSPTNQATFTAPATVTFSATATDSDGSVAELDLYVDGNQVASFPGSSTNQTLTSTQTLTNLTAGAHTLLAKATDNQGAVGTSASITVTIKSTTPSGTTLLNPQASPSAGNFTEFHFAVAPNPGTNYVLQTSTDLKTWTPVTATVVSTGTNQVELAVPRASTNAVQFFRLQVSP